MYIHAPVVPPAPAVAPGEGTAATRTDPVRAVPGAYGAAEEKCGRVAGGASPGPGAPANSWSKIFILVYL